MYIIFIMNRPIKMPDVVKPLKVFVMHTPARKV